MSIKKNSFSLQLARRRNLWQRWRSLPLAFIAICIGMYIAAITSAWSLGAIQEQEKTFEKLKPSRPEPVELVEIKTAKKAVKLGAKFHDSGNWLRGTTFKLRNSSSKDIVYVELDLNFPETASSGNEMSFPIKLGRRPGADNVASESLLVKPGDELTIRLDEKRYERLAKFIETRQPISSINKAKIRFGFIIFNDGTAWGAGNYYRQNPDNPNHYINIGPLPPTTNNQED